MGRRVLRFRRKLRTRLIVAGLALTAIISVAGLTSTVLTRAAPSWWRIYRPSAALNDRGAAVENAAVTHLYRQRQPDPAWVDTTDSGPRRSQVWSIAMTDEDASAWLTARLPAWIESQGELPEWPESLGRPQVRFDDGVVRVGVAVQRDDGAHILSANFRPDIRPDGSVWLRTNWVHIGRLPVPAGLVLDRAASRVRDRLPDTLAKDPHTADLARILAGDIPLAEEPVMNLEDGRAVRLVGLRVMPGPVELDLRTEIDNTLAKN